LAKYKWKSVSGVTFPEELRSSYDVNNDAGSDIMPQLDIVHHVITDDQPSITAKKRENNLNQGINTSQNLS